MKHIVTTVVGLTMGVMSASADLSLVDINGTSNVLTGTLTTLEGNLASPGGSASRWSTSIVGSDFVGVLPDPMTSTDVYVQWTGLAVPVSSARYVEVHYDVTGAAFTGDLHRLFPATTAVSGGINMADDFLIDGSPGTHSFIVDMFSDPTSRDYESGGGNWTAFRWDMWNETDLTVNAGKSITIDKLVFGSAIQAVPEPGTLGLVSLGVLAVMVRRRRQ